MIRRAHQRVGAYHYLFPTYGQAKKVIWEGKDKDSFPFLGHIPPELLLPRGGKNETELKLSFRNGSIIQLIGTDNYDAVIGTNPVGTVWSEYSLQDPGAWNYFRPILRENGGWAIFNFTPRGHNHGKTMYDMAMSLQAQGDPAWFCQKLTVDDTQAITAEDIDAERREGMDEDLIQQEFYCSFEGVLRGSIFGPQMAMVEKEGRICAVPWQRELVVDTWWDVGTGDATAIWFTQNVGREIHVIDYYENSGVGIGYDHYAKHLQSLPYLFGEHHGPHDMEGHHFAAGGKSAREQFAAMGLNFDIIPRTDKQVAINATRAILSRCYFDLVKTERGRLALSSYHYAWDDKRKVFLSVPYHDWSSNGSDAMQQMGVGHKFTPARVRERRDPAVGRVVQAGAEHLQWLGA